MTNSTGQPQPTNVTVGDRTGIHVQTMKVETATSMYAGRLVKKGTNDDDAVVNTDDNPPIGWISYEDTAKKHRPAAIATIYTVNSQIAIVNGPGILVVGSLASGQNVTKGTLLMATSSGELSGGTAGTHHMVAVAEESVNQSAGGSGDILVRSLV